SVSASRSRSIRSVSDSRDTELPEAGAMAGAACHWVVTVGSKGGGGVGPRRMGVTRSLVVYIGLVTFLGSVESRWLRSARPPVAGGPKWTRGEVYHLLHLTRE